MDSHADTCVAGPNFMILEFTGEQCDVTPYTSDYQPITNVAVVNAVTAFTDASTGVTVILRFNQVLWYGKRMKMSLINPNQLRHFGIAVSDDPTDKTRPFGIVTEDQEIPFQMDGTPVYFETRGETAIAKVVKRAKDNNGNPIGKRNANPLLDTRDYECELEDGSVMRYNANIIAENIFAQCDDAGRRQAILDEIVDHKSDKRALRADNGYVTTKRGRRVPKNTTKG